MLRMNNHSSPIIEKPADLVLWQNELLYFVRLYLEMEVTAHQISKVVLYPYSATRTLTRKELEEFGESIDRGVYVDDKLLKRERDGIPIKEMPYVNNDFVWHDNIMTVLYSFRNLFINNPIDCFIKENSFLTSAYIFKSNEYTVSLFKTAFAEISDRHLVYVSEGKSRKIIHRFFRKHEDFSDSVKELAEEDSLVRCFIELILHRGYEQIFEEFPNDEDFKEYKSEKIKEMPAALKIMQKWNLTPTDVEKVIFPRLRTLSKKVLKP